MKRIVLPSAEYRIAFYKMAREYRETEDRRYYRDIIKHGFDYEEYITRLHRYSLGICLEEGLSPFTTYWLVDEAGDTIYGVSRLRHKLTKTSQKEGGHIGYDVPPSCRNAGNATELLRQTLLKARARGFIRVLVTCDADNRASARVIEKNGGKMENQVISDYTKKIVNRYWIEC
jgi:predicted acetyltransferase